MAHIRPSPGDMGITMNGIIILRLQGTGLVLHWLPSRLSIPNTTRHIRITRTLPHQVRPTMVLPKHTTVAVSMEPRLEEALIVMPRLHLTLMTIVITITHRIIQLSPHIRLMDPTLVTLRVVTTIRTLLTRTTVTIVGMMMDTTL